MIYQELMRWGYYLTSVLVRCYILFEILDNLTKGMLTMLTEQNRTEQ